MSVDHAQPRKPRPRTLTDLGVDHAMGPVARVQAAGQMIEMQKKHLAGTKLEVRDVEEKDEADRIIAVIAQLRLTQRELAHRVQYGPTRVGQTCWEFVSSCHDRQVYTR